MTTTKSYDLLNRLTSIQSINSQPSTINSFAYAYNDANQRTAVTNADASRWNFGYDTLGQVTSGKKSWSDGTKVAGEQFEYTFDDIGNRKQSRYGGDANGSFLRRYNYSANLLNQYTSRSAALGATRFANILGEATNTATVTVNDQATYRRGDFFRLELAVTNTSPVWLGVTNIAVLNQGTTNDLIATNLGSVFVPPTPEAFGYDADGNMTNDGRFVLTWDAENRLVKVESLTNAPAGSKRRLEFAYDHHGRRIQKTAWTNSGSGYVAQYTNRFAYDGWNLLSILSSDLSMRSSFVWGLDLSGSMQDGGGVGGLLQTWNSELGVRNFVSYDGNGNVMALVNAADGSTTAQYEYGPFGELLRVTGLMGKANPFRFSTKYQDDESDLLYYGYRYYASGTGRWLSRDPIEEKGGVNLYGFVANYPVNAIDKLGQSIVGKVVVFVATGTTKGFKTIKTVERMEDAAKLLGEGEDIVFKSESAAREAAKLACNGATPIKEFDVASQSWHYHLASRGGGHALFSAVAVVTLSYHANGQGAVVETAAAVGDLVNPLSVGQDVLDIYQVIYSLYVPEITLVPVHTYHGPNGEIYIGRNPPSGYKIAF